MIKYKLQDSLVRQEVTSSGWHEDACMQVHILLHCLCLKLCQWIILLYQNSLKDLITALTLFLEHSGVLDSMELLV